MVGVLNCAEQLRQLFCVRPVRNDPELEPTVTPLQKLPLINKFREDMVLALQLLYDGD